MSYDKATVEACVELVQCSWPIYCPNNTPPKGGLENCLAVLRKLYEDAPGDPVAEQGGAAGGGV